MLPVQLLMQDSLDQDSDAQIRYPEVMNNISIENAQLGCFLGLAVGDALGAPVEFQPPGTFQPVTDFRAAGARGLNPGDWTDDTSMALALADSIKSVGWDLDDQARRYLSWWHKGEYTVSGKCFDIGFTTRAALSRFAETGDARSSGDPSESSSGNGSIMRLAPVAIRFMDMPIETLARVASESSIPTHASSQCRSACRYLAAILAGLMRGLDRDQVLSPDWQSLCDIRRLDPLHPNVDLVARGSFRRHQPPAIVGSGYVVKSLEAALWSFCNANNFEEAVLKAVNLGDDADTTGAVCGQLAGAFWGKDGIPSRWTKGLTKSAIIESAAAGLRGANPDDQC